VNVSIGGTLTFLRRAAGADGRGQVGLGHTAFMMSTFGWRASRRRGDQRVDRDDALPQGARIPST